MASSQNVNPVTTTGSTEEHKDNVEVNGSQGNPQVNFKRSFSYLKWIEMCFFFLLGVETVTTGTHVTDDVGRQRHFGFSGRRQIAQLGRHRSGTAGISL